jgi:hypothetical protein
MFEDVERIEKTNEDLLLSPREAKKVDKAISALHEVFDESFKRLFLPLPREASSMGSGKDRVYLLGFGSTLIRGNGSANIHVQPLCRFQPERIIIPSDVARHFMITDVKVGKNSQFLSPGAIPALAFAEGMFGVRLRMDRVQISMFVTFSVSNIDYRSHNFQGVILGSTCE